MFASGAGGATNAGCYHLCHRESAQLGKMPSKWLNRHLIEQEAFLQTGRKQGPMDQGNFFLLPQA